MAVEVSIIAQVNRMEARAMVVTMAARKIVMVCKVQVKAVDLMLALSMELAPIKLEEAEIRQLWLRVTLGANYLVEPIIIQLEGLVAITIKSSLLESKISANPKSK